MEKARVIHLISFRNDIFCLECGSDYEFNRQRLTPLTNYPLKNSNHLSKDRYNIEIPLVLGENVFLDAIVLVNSDGTTTNLSHVPDHEWVVDNHGNAKIKTTCVTVFQMYLGKLWTSTTFLPTRGASFPILLKRFRN